MGKQLERHWPQGQGSRIAAAGAPIYEFAMYRLMDGAVKERVELILCAFKAGTITPKQASTMLGIDASAVYELLSGEPE
jgi:hypothetical protein